MLQRLGQRASNALLLVLVIHGAEAVPGLHVEGLEVVAHDGAPIVPARVHRQHVLDENAPAVVALSLSQSIAVGALVKFRKEDLEPASVVLS